MSKPLPFSWKDVILRAYLRMPRVLFWCLVMQMFTAQTDLTVCLFVGLTLGTFISEIRAPESADEKEDQ